MSVETSYEISRADLYRAYARIMAAPRRVPGSGMQPPTAICLASAECLSIVADMIERGDPHLPKVWQR